MRQLMLLCSMLLVASVAHAAEMSGKIAAINPAQGTLEISGVTINAKDAEVRGLLTSSSLKKFMVGDKVEVEGEFIEALQMRATRVEKKVFDHFEINATLDEVDIKSRVLKIGGITITVPEDIAIEDPEDEPTTIDKLAKGQLIEVEGNWTGSGKFTATKIEMQKTADESKEEEEEEEKD